MWQRILIVAASIVVPVVWGVVVNWLFDSWRSRASQDGGDESIYPDYQI